MGSGCNGMAQDSMTPQLTPVTLFLAGPNLVTDQMLVFSPPCEHSIYDSLPSLVLKMLRVHAETQPSCVRISIYSRSLDVRIPGCGTQCEEACFRFHLP